jgi:predicted RNase H-like HicB family nuclease
MEGKKDLSFYLKLKYPVQVEEQEGGWFFARIPDLPGCMSDGKSPAEAMKHIAEAKALWLEGALESEFEIPLPKDSEEFSGRVLVRLPRFLHRELIAAAEREDTSLNQYLVALLAERNALRAAARRIGETKPVYEAKPQGSARRQPRMVEHVADKPRVKYCPKREIPKP